MSWVSLEKGDIITQMAVLKEYCTDFYFFIWGSNGAALHNIYPKK